ncbi:MAG TPA: hypothetical protein VJ486_03665 [Geothrix sp.]|nr:hypothetical protein [Geothrix sp.]
MLNPAALQLAAELGGTLLGGASGELLLVERVQRHALPQLLVLGRSPGDLAVPLEAAGRVQAEGLELNVLALLPMPGCDLAAALALHRQRLGALVAALDGGLSWLNDKPMLARRLPGSIFAPAPLPLAKAPMGPLEKAELKAFLSDWEKERRKQTFRKPGWRAIEGGFETELWPGVPLPAGAELRIPPLELPCMTPLTDALRSALRSATGGPVPILPLSENPFSLHALRELTPSIAAFCGPREAWEQALRNVARLPSPPHFCARC